MSLKTRLRISIVALVTIVVAGLSALYVYDFTFIAFDAADKRADVVQNQVKAYVLERIDSGLKDRNLHPVSLADSKQAWTDTVRTDPFIPAMLERSVAGADIVVNIHVTGEDGVVLATSDPLLAGKPDPAMQSFQAVLQRNAFRNLWEIMTRRKDYSKTLGLGVPQDPNPVFKVVVVISSTLLDNAVRSVLLRQAIAFFACLVIAIVLAFLLPTLVLSPLERLGRRIDLIRTGEVEAMEPEKRHETREFAAVQSKLNLLGQQFRGAKQDALQLRSNLEEMLQRLEEAVLLFDASGVLMMAGRPAERLLGKGREEILGQKLSDLFPPSTVLGAAIAGAMEHNQPLRDRLVTIDRNGAGSASVLVNMELLRKGVDGQEIGALITLRDAESRRQLQRQFDVSTRLAAISRLMGGVAHEIKNPLNAMALHLEVLRTRLDGDDPEIQVISAEIKRLDRVVKTFLNFNKPLDTQMRVLDIAALSAEVVHLVSPDAAARGIAIDTQLTEQLWINGDPDLLKQVVLNVVMNALEAMESAGRLTIRTEEEDGENAILISDNGPGIPPEIQDKIFNLYFSTKETGTGIGLAMAFRVVQLHGGTIDFSSEIGKGTLFRLRFPALTAYEAGRAVQHAHT
jgi:PAS domain S-box-containing protein